LLNPDQEKRKKKRGGERRVARLGHDPTKLEVKFGWATQFLIVLEKMFFLHDPTGQLKVQYMIEYNLTRIL
jgi:hypothetical protein